MLVLYDQALCEVKMLCHTLTKIGFGKSNKIRELKILNIFEDAFRYWGEKRLTCFITNIL